MRHQPTTNTYFSVSCINLVTTETLIDFKKLQLLYQLCRLPCIHLSKSVFVHRLVSFMNGDKQWTSTNCWTNISYILTFLKDALFPSKSLWRAILRQHVVQSNTQTMKQELIHNGNEWLSPNVVGTNSVSNLWIITLSFTSMQKTTTYSRLVHF